MSDWEETPVRGDADVPGDLPAMDALFESQVDQDVVRRTESDALPQAGTYITIPELTMTAMAADRGPYIGRPLFRFFGRGVMRVQTEAEAKRVDAPVGTELAGGFRFTVSPIRANAVREDGTILKDPDNASKLWAFAVRTYQKAIPGTVPTVGAVLRFLRDYPVAIRVARFGVPTERNPEPRGTPGTYVLAISLPRGEG